MTDMTIGKPRNLIIKFSIPLLLGNLLQQMYNIVDSIVIGNFAEKEALAAVGNSFIINFLLISLFMGIGLGATILISQFFGAKDEKKVHATVDTIYLAMIAGSIFVTVVGLVFATPILKLMNTPEGKTMALSESYLRTLFIGSIASFGFNVNSSILQGTGDSKSPLIFLAIATVINTILDLLFVAVFKMSVFGAALATIIAQLIAFIFSIVYINKRNQLLNISFPTKMHFNKEIMLKSIKLGLPAGIQNMLFCLGTMALLRLVNGYGPGFMSGYNAVNKIDTFAFLPITSISTAVTTYVGQNIGAKNLARARQGIRSANIISFITCAFMSLLVFIFGRYLLMAFSRDPEILLTGTEFIKRLMPPYVLLSITFILNSAMRGAGQSLFPMISSIVALILARVPSAYFFDYYFGKYNMFWCFAFGWVIGVTITIIYYLSGHWIPKELRPIKEIAK